ncbi:AbrB family transcriptional regulator [Neobacillus drentensis]|uniref:AbrB family transcriptional regulator n=1 Tax=Neobacillus drentensis TaxID=220684 RepID=UPI0008240C40|nr:AbrB family transcriptional regulator [Neobacillus drentensis]
MQKLQPLKQNILYILLSALGGMTLSYSGIPMAWMLGSLFLASVLSSLRLKRLKFQREKNGLHPLWPQIGQLIIGIQLGQTFNLSIMDTMEDYFLIIIIMLISSITMAILSGIMLWRFSSVNMMTSLFGTTPGGISAMPTIADEVGANAFIVSIVQTIRVLLVISLIPFISGVVNSPSVMIATKSTQGPLSSNALLHTGILIIGGCLGAKAGKRIKMPAPWLVGSMIGAGIFHLICPLFIGDIVGLAYWPQEIIIIAQVLIGTNIGSRVNFAMFKGLGQTIIVGLLSSLCLIVSMLAFSFLISEMTNITFVTCLLAFAPGGVAEMATTAIALHADTTFVVAVQSLRLISILTILPPIFRFLNNHTISEISDHS